MLTARPLVFIGLISYSLYLWHWPLVAFTKYLLFRPFTGIDSAAIILASLLLATFSWKFIEQPFRGKQMLLPERKRLFAVAGVVMVVAVGIGGVIHLQKGMAWRIDRFYPEMTSVVDKAKNDPVWNEHNKWEKQTVKIGEGVTPPVVGANAALPSFALVGDSHARALIPAIEKEAKESGTAGFIITKSSTPLLKSISRISQGRDDNGFDEAAHNDAVFGFIKNNPSIKIIILPSRWGGYINGHWTEKGEDQGESKFHDNSVEYSDSVRNDIILMAGLKRTVEILIAMNRKVVLVSDVPEIGFDVSRVYMMQSRFPFLTKNSEYRPSIAEYNERQKEANAILEELAKLPNVTLIRPEKMMFDETGHGRIMANGELLYRDDDHLSTAGALYVAPVFEPLFKEMARTQSAHQRVSEN